MSRERANTAFNDFGIATLDRPMGVGQGFATRPHDQFECRFGGGVDNARFCQFSGFNRDIGLNAGVAVAIG